MKIIENIAIVLLLVIATGIPACTSSNSTSTKTMLPEPERLSQDLAKDAAIEEYLIAAVNTAATLDTANPLLLSSLYSLAEFYRHQKKYDKAEAIYQQCLSLKEETNGPNHPDVAVILDHYASLLREANRGLEAIKLEARARAIRR